MNQRSRKSQSLHLSRMRARVSHRPRQPHWTASQLVPERDRNMAKASEIESLECAWYVGKRRPLSDLPAWKRWLVRSVYFAVGWCTADGVEAQAICTSKELAEEMAGKNGWFYHELPINIPLPDETCRFRAHVFPSSEVAQRYEALRLPIGAVKVAEIEQVQRKIDRLVRSASA